MLVENNPFKGSRDNAGSNSEWIVVMHHLPMEIGLTAFHEVPSQPERV